VSILVLAFKKQKLEYSLNTLPLKIKIILQIKKKECKKSFAFITLGNGVEILRRRQTPLGIRVISQHLSIFYLSKWETEVGVEGPWNERGGRASPTHTHTLTQPHDGAAEGQAGRGEVSIDVDLLELGAQLVGDRVHLLVLLLHEGPDLLPEVLLEAFALAVLARQVGHKVCLIIVAKAVLGGGVGDAVGVPPEEGRGLDGGVGGGRGDDHVRLLDHVVVVVGGDGGVLPLPQLAADKADGD